MFCNFSLTNDFLLQIMSDKDIFYQSMENTVAHVFGKGLQQTLLAICLFDFFFFFFFFFFEVV